MQALEMLASLVSSGVIQQKRANDIKTTLNKLAEAYQIDPEDLDLASIEESYADTLKTYFAALGSSVSPYTIRNTYQNLRQLYRAAQASALLPTGRMGVQPRRRYSRQAVLQDLLTHSPYLRFRTGKAAVRYAVPLQQWPPEIAKGWRSYAAIKSIQVRQTSLRRYTQIFSAYIGYNLQHDEESPEHWDQVFEIPRLTRWLAWHADRVSAERISRGGRDIVDLCIDIAKHLERPDLITLKKFLGKLPKPTKIYDKKAERHTVALVDLDRLGSTLMAEARQASPHERHARTKNGAWRAVKFATGLAIRFLVRCPRRKREMVEMDLGGRLYQDARGTWQLYYKSHQLKIAEHDGMPNEFRMAWPPDLVGDLEEYLATYRPILLGDSTSTAVFVSTRGRPVNETTFRDRIVLVCWDRLKKHVYPHLFRTLWCDAYLDAHPGDWEGAAAMLNDTPETIQSWYRQFRVKQHLAKGIDFNAQLFGNGHRKGMPR